MPAPRRPLTKSGMLNQFAGSAISTATGFAIGSVIAPTLAPLTQSLLNETWNQIPVRPLNASTAAEAAARGYAAEASAQSEAQHTGYNASRFNLLKDVATIAPPRDDLFDLWRRGLIQEDDVQRGFKQRGIRDEWNTRLRKLKTILVPVSDLIRMAVREVFDPALRSALDLDRDYPEALTAHGAALGLSEEDTRNYWAAHWELPSETQMAQMMFRGEISEAQFEQGLQALDFAPTWRSKLSTILHPIPALSDMIRFAVREVYDPAKRAALGLDAEFPQAFATAAALHGLDDEYAKQYWAAHWRLPSAQQGYRMLWRGEISAAQLDELLKALDYPTLWRDRLANIAHIVPGRIDLRRMFAADVITRQQVHDGYVKIGYTPADAETLTKFAEQQKASGAVTHTKWADRAKSRLFTVTHNEYLDERPASTPKIHLWILA